MDDAHQHVFVTGDPGDGVVLVSDLTGHVVKTFSGESGAAGMVLSGTTLYVARCDSSTIDTFDTASLTKTGSISTGETIGVPCDLAMAGSRLWFTSNDHLASVALAAGHSVVSYGDDIGGMFSTVPGATDLLLVNQGPFNHGGPVWLYSVSGGAPQTLGQTGSWTAAQLVPPYGASVLATHQTQDNVYEGPTPSLYPTNTQYDFRLSAAPALAVAADGGHFAASGMIGYDETATISLFERGAGNPRMPYAMLPESAPVLGMAFSADDSRLFAVERDGGVVLRVISSPLRPGSIIFLGSTFAEIQIGDPLDYGANLSFSDGASTLGTSVALTLTDPAGHHTSLGTVTADAQGDIAKSLADAFDQPGDWFLRADYSGDATHQRTAATKRIIVSKRNAILHVGVTSKPLVAGTTTTVSGMLTLLGPDAVAGRDISVYATPPGGSELLIGTAVTDAVGAYSIETMVDGGGAWTFRAAYAGDDRYAPAAGAPVEVTANRQQPQVSIAAGRTLVTYGSKVTLTATLGPTHTNRVVQIVRIAPNGSRAIIGQGPVDAGGRFRFIAGPGQTNRYIAQFPGDEWFAPATSKAVTIQVRPVVSVVARNAYRTVSGIRWFHYAPSCVTSGRGCPLFTGGVRPNHAGKLVEFVLQRRNGTRWAAAGSARFRLGRLSQKTVLLHYRSSTVRSGYLRMRMHFFADADHVSADSAWLIFRIT